MNRLSKIGLVLLLGLLPAWAHPLLQDAMLVESGPAQLRLTVNVSLAEISVAEGVPLGPFGVADSEAWDLAVQKHRDYLLKHLGITSGTNRLTGHVTGVAPPAEFDQAENTFYQYKLIYPASGSLPASLELSQDMLKEWPYAPGTAWDVSYVLHIKSAGSNTVTSSLLTRRQPVTIATGNGVAAGGETSGNKTDAYATFSAYLWHGIWHILTGYDHLLFVAALVLAVNSFWEMVKVIAAFTCAHTLTLSLSVFDIFRLPSGIVEPVISLSIVLVALENILWPERAHSRARLAIAFGFGLIHGLGFAGGLLDAMQGLPPVSLWIALGAFSLGVEIGHQVVVLPLFGLLKLNRRRSETGLPAPALRYGSAVIACGGAGYLVVALREQWFLH